MGNQNANAFVDLVKSAPTKPSAEIVTLTGVLWQPSDPSRFGLTFGDGRSATFDLATVKSHLVLYSSVGATIVRVDLDASRELQLNDRERFLAFGGWGTSRAHNSTHLGKPPKDPIGDTYDSDPMSFHQTGKPPKDPIGDTYDNDDPRGQFYGNRVPFYALPHRSAVPFALATSSQVPSYLVDYLQSFTRHYHPTRRGPENTWPWAPDVTSYS